MLRLTLLLTVCLAGCGGPPPPTLQEQYAAAVGEFDRESAKLARMAIDTPNLDQQAVCLAYFMLRGTLPNERQFMVFKEALSTRRRFENRYLAHVYRCLPQQVARREQFEKVEQLHEQAQQAHDAWMDAVRPPRN